MNPKKRVGLVRSDLSGAGGAERYMLTVLRRLADAGYETHVFTGRLPGDFSGDIQAHLFRPGKRRLPRMLRHYAYQKWLGEIVPQQNLDFLLSLERVLPNDIYRAGGGVHRVWRDLCLQDLHGARRFALKNSAAHRQMLRSERDVFDVRHTRMVICNSQMVADEIVRFYPYPRERIRVVPNGVDTEKFCAAPPDERAALRSARGFAPGDCVALFAGSGFWRKGVDRALEIVARWRALTKQNIKLVVVGRAENNSFSELASKRGLNSDVLFTGAQPPAAMREWYQLADIFLFPTRYDPFANACLEAAACGVPVVTTRQNGFAEHLVEGQAGLILSGNNEADARALDDLARNLPSSDAVRRSISHLSLEAHIKKLLAVFDDAAQFPLPAGLRATR